MAGSQDSDENPVAINVVPMVDVIFCLCVFFMCSFKFREQEIDFSSWLPKRTGAGPGQPTLVEEVRVTFRWDDAAQRTIRRLGARESADDREFTRAVRAALADVRATGGGERPVTIDADPRVPWDDVMNVVDWFSANGIDRLEFAAAGR